MDKINNANLASNISPLTNRMPIYFCYPDALTPSTEEEVTLRATIFNMIMLPLM
jgi:hypothetical protein